MWRFCSSARDFGFIRFKGLGLMFKGLFLRV